MQRRWLALILIVICAALVISWARRSGGEQSMPSYAELERAAMNKVTSCSESELHQRADFPVDDGVLRTSALQSVCKRREACLLVGEHEKMWCDTRFERELSKVCEKQSGDPDYAREGIGTDICAYHAGVMLSLVYGTEVVAPSGELTEINVSQVSDGLGTDNVRVCGAVENTATHAQKYTLEMREAGGVLVDRSVESEIDPMDTSKLCVGSENTLVWRLADLSDTVTIALRAETDLSFHAHPGSVVVGVQDVSIR